MMNNQTKGRWGKWRIGDKRKAQKVLMGKLEGKGQLRKSGRELYDDNKIDVKAIG
jgi:hypothetical protein